MPGHRARQEGALLLLQLRPPAAAEHLGGPRGAGGDEPSASAGVSEALHVSEVFLLPGPRRIDL